MTTIVLPPELVAERHYRIAIDGACKNNPGPGGWGACLQSFEDGTLLRSHELFGSAHHTTNNAMELTAAIKALEWLFRNSKNLDIPVLMLCDSEYVVKGMTEWLPRWQANGWRNSDGKPVKNRELWERLVELAAQRPVHWFWVKGHDGHADNERAHDLAQKGLLAQLQKSAA